MKEKTRTPVLCVDLLVRLKVALFIRELFLEDDFLGEEHIDIEKLRELLSQADDNTLLARYEEDIKKYEIISEQRVRSGNARYIDIVDPLDGTRNWANVLKKYAFSWGRTEWNEEKKLYIPVSGVIYAPEYSLTFKGNIITGPLLEFDRAHNIVRLWRTEIDGSLSLVSDSISFDRDRDYSVGGR